MNRASINPSRIMTSTVVQFSVERVFSLPIGFVTWNEYIELNDQLRRLILEKSRVDDGIPLSKTGGWHSRDDFFSWTHSVIPTLQERILRSVAAISSLLGQKAERADEQSWSILSWANVMQNGHHVDLHHHGQHDLAGVYYVDPGAEAKQGALGGTLEIQDPASKRLVVTCRDLSTRGSNLGFRTIQSDERFFSIVPEEGLMIIFPGSVRHRVTTYSGTRPRISVSFNATRADASMRAKMVARTI